MRIYNIKGKRGILKYLSTAEPDESLSDITSHRIVQLLQAAAKIIHTTNGYEYFNNNLKCLRYRCNIDHWVVVILLRGPVSTTIL